MPVVAAVATAVVAVVVAAADIAVASVVVALETDIAFAVVPVLLTCHIDHLTLIIHLHQIPRLR